MSLTQFDHKFLEQYHTLWSIRKDHLLKKKPLIPSPSPHLPQNHKPFYYKDSYEICSVKQFLKLLQTVEKQNQRIKDEKTQLAHKKLLLCQLKKENLIKDSHNFLLNHHLKQKTNQIYSPKAYKKDRAYPSFSKISLKFDNEVKWLTNREIDVQLSRLMTSETKINRKKPLTEYLLESPMFKNGAKRIDNAFSYYLDKKNEGIPLKKMKAFPSRTSSLDENKLKTLYLNTINSPKKPISEYYQ